MHDETHTIQMMATVYGGHLSSTHHSFDRPILVLFQSCSVCGRGSQSGTRACFGEDVEGQTLSLAGGPWGSTANDTLVG